MSTFVFLLTTIAQVPCFAIHWQYSAHDGSDYIAPIAIVHWHLYAKTHPGGEVVSTVISKGGGTGGARRAIAPPNTCAGGLNSPKYLTAIPEQ